MIVTFLRSSSIGTYRSCETSYLCNYVLGIPSVAGKAAAKGNVVHKALETLTWKSKHAADGVVEYNDETFGDLKVAEITVDWAVEAAYDHYKRLEPHLSWNDKLDLADCHNWTNKLLTKWDGYFNPANMDIVEPEVKFDITIDEPWAAYRYETANGIVEGQLGLKGTVDLVVRDKHDPDIYEVIDYKTGRQTDFATGEAKGFDGLWKDHQLLLYYYALSRLYPTKKILMTIVFINYDGPFRLDFGPEDLERAEDMLRRTFEQIRDNQAPAKVPAPMTWKCQRICPYNKPSKWNSNLSICDYVRGRVATIGIQAATDELGKPGAYNAYGDGGGRKAAQ